MILKIKGGILHFFGNGIVIEFSEPVDVGDRFFELMDASAKLIRDEQEWFDTREREYEPRDGVRVVFRYGVIEVGGNKRRVVDRVSVRW